MNSFHYNKVVSAGTEVNTKCSWWRGAVDDLRLQAFSSQRAVPRVTVSLPMNQVWCKVEAVTRVLLLCEGLLSPEECVCVEGRGFRWGRGFSPAQREYSQRPGNAS